MKVFLCVVSALAAVQAQDTPSRLVNITQGPVRGYKEPGLDVFSFYSIPYAKAPTGPDKYKPPLPAPTWVTPFEATNKFVICHQYNIFGPNFPHPFIEECLVASVFVPDTNVTNLLPVVVFIHGGAFSSEWGNIETPTQLVNQEKNVIAVTFNYRLGTVGFLCLGTPDIPGNAGMRDQVAALKWVQQNIASFGGNPNDVTIAGCSAGGASVDLHLLTKVSRGLFNKVIPQSGGNIGPFAVQIDPILNARNLAKDFGYSGPDNIESLEAFFKNVSYDTMNALSLHENKDVEIKMSPCLERDIGIERFLEDTPINIIKKGDFIRLPILYGWTNMEGIFRLYVFDTWKNEMNENFTAFLPSDLKFDSEEQRQQIAEKVKQYYFGGPVGNNNVLRFIDYITDVTFNVAMQRAVTMQVEAGNNNMYIGVYSFSDNQTMVIPHTNERGANHCDQSVAILDLDESNLTSEYLELRKAWRAVWLNFITKGEPTPEENMPPLFPKWEPAHANRTPCMDIGRTVRVYPGPFDLERQQFWDAIYDVHKKDPIPPYDFNAAMPLYSGLMLSIFVSLLTIFKL